MNNATVSTKDVLESLIHKAATAIAILELGNSFSKENGFEYGPFDCEILGLNKTLANFKDQIEYNCS